MFKLFQDLPSFFYLLTLSETKILVITLIFPEAKTHSRARALGLVGLLGLFYRILTG